MASNLLVNATLTPRTELGCPTSTFALDAAAEIKYMHAQGLDATLFLWFPENSSFLHRGGLGGFLRVREAIVQYYSVERFNLFWCRPGHSRKSP